MKALWLLAAAITIGACANRSEDEVGVAPESVPTDSAEGQRTSPAPSNEASGTPSESVPTDSAQGQITSPAPTNEASGMSGDSAEVGPVQGDSALTDHDVPPADSTAGQPQ